MAIAEITQTSQPGLEATQCTTPGQSAEMRFLMDTLITYW